MEVEVRWCAWEEHWWLWWSWEGDLQVKVGRRSLARSRSEEEEGRKAVFSSSSSLSWYWRPRGGTACSFMSAKYVYSEARRVTTMFDDVEGFWSRDPVGERGRSGGASQRGLPCEPPVQLNERGRSQRPADYRLVSCMPVSSSIFCRSCHHATG